MAKRRKNGEGTLTRRANGRWRVVILIHGKRHSFTASTQSECLNWLREIQNKNHEGIDPESGNLPLALFIERWLTRISASRSPGTLDVYTRATRPVVKSLGRMPMRDIRPNTLQSFYDSQTASGKSAHYVRKIHKALHVAFQEAVRLKIVIENPAASTIPPKPNCREMAFYDEAQVQSLLMFAESKNDYFYPLYFMAIHTGMRQAELLGLKWLDVKWDVPSVIVQRQLQYLDGGGFEFRKPKSKSGRRTIALSNLSIEALKIHRDNQWELSRNKANAWKDHGLVFPSRVGTPVQPSNLRRSFRKFLRESGMPKIRFHDLRHTAAALMLNHGIPLLVVSKRLGHSKPSITLDIYGHLIPNQQAEAAKLMDQLMTPVSFPITPELHQNEQI